VTYNVFGGALNLTQAIYKVIAKIIKLCPTEAEIVFGSEGQR